MMGDEDAVIATNDDAATCKRYAVRAGYWVDPYIEHFVKNSPERKAPEISRGYYARVMGMKSLLDQFLLTTNYNCQVVNLGCGFDTLFWRLKDEGVSIQSFVEVDLPAVTARKSRAIRSRRDLLTRTLDSEEDDVQFSQYEMHAGEYHLIGCDIRNSNDLTAKLLDSKLLNPSTPTAFLAECVLVYNPPSPVHSLLTLLAERFPSSLFLSYDMVRLDSDPFGAVLKDTLARRGIHGAALCVAEDPAAQAQRFISAGWDGARAWDMCEVWRHLDTKEVQRVEALEFLDERELLMQLLTHYCITAAYRGETLEDIGFN